jgi:3-hydroxymyristoyl/3-hydroxydecanoyl-(acyl carrier protein) dehydratase
MLLSAALDYAQLQFGNELRIGGIEHAKFTTPLLPNQAAQLTISRLATRLKFSIALGDTLIAQGQFALVESAPLTTP